MTNAMFGSGETKIPRWHFTMLRDKERNAAIESCISGLELKGKVVLEIGCGAGLPAILFAKYGARHVITCEMDPRIADVAREVIQRNNLSDRITVLSKPSWQAIEDGDIPLSPDFIFTETLDCGVIGEGYEAISNDIRKIAGAKTIVIPQKVDQYGFLCSEEQLFNKNSVFTECKIDLSSLNAFADQTYFSMNQLLYEPHELTPTMLMRRYDYLDPGVLAPAQRDVLASHSGVCHGLVTFFNVHFGEFVVSSRTKQSHWAMAFHPLAQPVQLEEGCRYRVAFSEIGNVVVS